MPCFAGDTTIGLYVSPCRPFWLALCRIALACLLLAAPRAALADKSGVSPDKLHLPKGPGSLEGVGENVEPNFNMGLMSYRVPIAVPSGHAGVTPELALNYGSGSGNSEVGIGWSLAIPAIERMTSRGLPRYLANDTFAAGGSDELVRVDANGVYRARNEKGFVRYTWIDGEDGTEGYWTAEYPDGRVGYFGADAGGTSVTSARVRGAGGTFRYHLVEVVDVHGHALRYFYEKDGEAARVSRIAYAFDGDTPRYEVRFSYEQRDDPLSDAKPGVVVSVSERLREIQVLARGTQVRRYELAYESRATSGGLSRLSRVRWFGLNDEGPFPIQFSFAYSAGLATSTPSLVAMEGSTGVDFGAGTADLVDLNSDGLPDVVDTAAPEHRIFLNGFDESGAHRFSNPVTSDVGTLALNSPSTEMFDLDGDGTSDMVDSVNQLVLWNRGTGDWQSEDLLATLNLPSLAEDANLRFFDYDNDKRTDLLHADRTGSWVYANQGDGSFTVVDMGLDSIGASFVEDNLQLSDMNGDGLQDVTRKALDFVAYRTNLGLGRFADWTEMTGLTSALSGDEQLVDLNGDSLADLVAVRADTVIYQVNQDGASFGDPVTLRASDDLPLPERTSSTSIRFADMNGSGSTDVVWVNASGGFTYLELFPKRPNLLSRIDNGIGKVIEIAYGSSSEHLRRDGGDWSLRLPHPMLTVDEIVVRDELSGVEQRQSIAYRNGYYDGSEKQFRGFANVSVTAPGDESAESGVRTLEFDVGSSDDYRKGLLLLETQASGERELSATEHRYDDCELEGVPATTPAVRFICPASVVRTLKEGRRESEWVTTEERFEHDGYGQKVLAAKLGVTSIGGGGCSECANPARNGAPCGDVCSGDESYESFVFIPPSAEGRWILGKVRRSRSYATPDSDVFSERTYYYDGDAFDGLPAGELERGTLSRVRAKVTVDGSDHVDIERYARDEHGQVTESLDADGRRRLYEYDDDGLLLLSESVALDEADEPYELTMSVEYDPLLDLVVRSTAWTMVGATTESLDRVTNYAYDEFGRLRAIARPGDSLEAPTEEFRYEIAAPVSRIVRRARSEVDGDLDLEDAQCFDGLGRSLQKRTLVRPGHYEVSGFVEFNALGKSYREYQAYANDSSACDLAAPGTEATESLYDASGRELRVIQPDAELYGTPSLIDTEYFPLRTVTRDAEDTLIGSDAPHANTPSVTHVDGLGRTVAVERYLTPDEALRTTYFYDELGHLAGYVDAHGNTKTQGHDLLGRVRWVEDPDSGTTSYAYDGAGNIITRTDARNISLRVAYDGAGRKLAEWEADNEDETRIDYVYDAIAGCEECENGEGLLVRASYPLSEEGTERGEDHFGYDERGQPAYVARTLGGTRFEFRTEFDNAGRITKSRYPGGVEVPFTYDGAGRVTSAGDYVPEVVYDDRGLVEALSLGNGAQTTYGYDVLDRLDAVDTSIPGDQALQATRFTRDRVGNVLSVLDESVPDDLPSVNAIYTYDALYRLKTARLDPERERAELLEFAYDEIDNLVSKTSDLDDSPDHVGELHYGEDGAGPHAVTNAGGVELSYGPAGHLESRDGTELEWDFLGRLSRSTSGDTAGARFFYGTGDDRVKKSEQGRTSYYLTSDFELRDGTAVLYVRVGGQRVAKVEMQDFAAEYLPDLAPVTLDGDEATPDPDRLITAGDAWIAQAAAEGIFELDATPGETTVDELLAASVKRLLGESAPDGAVVNYFHHDHLGSVVAVTNADGAVIERRANYPYGLDRSRGPPLEVDYSFTGKERDLETGLVFFGARYYAPEIGRFVSADPLFAVMSEIGGPQALNRFAYGANNPIGTIDHNGEIAETAWDVINIGLGVVSLVSNIKDGNYKAAAVDALGVALDTAAAALPFVPGGASTAIKAVRATKMVVERADAIKTVATGRDLAGNEVGAVGRGAAALSLLTGTRGPKTNAAASNVASSKAAFHGNSRLSTNAQHGYEIVDTTTGKVVKTGVSGGARTANVGNGGLHGSVRANRQVNAWNKAEGQPGRYKANVVHEVPAGPGAREQVLQWEGGNAARLREDGHLNDHTKHSRP